MSRTAYTVSNHIHIEESEIAAAGSHFSAIFLITEPVDPEAIASILITGLECVLRRLSKWDVMTEGFGWKGSLHGMMWDFGELCGVFTTI